MKGAQDGASGFYDVVVENTSTLVGNRVIEVMPDLVLLDIAMPDKHGGDINFEIQQDRRTQNIPIIFLTAMVTKVENATNGGVIAGTRSLTKPLCIDE